MSDVYYNAVKIILFGIITAIWFSRWNTMGQIRLWSFSEESRGLNSGSLPGKFHYNSFDCGSHRNPFCEFEKCKYTEVNKLRQINAMLWKLRGGAGPCHVTITYCNTLHTVIAGKLNKSNVHALAFSLRDQLCDTKVRTSRYQSDMSIKMSSVHDSSDSKKSTTKCYHVLAFTENTLLTNREEISNYLPFFNKFFVKEIA